MTKKFFVFTAVVWLLLMGTRIQGQTTCNSGNSFDLQLTVGDVTLVLSCVYGRDSINGQFVPAGNQLMIMTGHIMNAAQSSVNLYDGDFFLTINGSDVYVAVPWAERVASEFGLDHPRGNSIFIAPYIVSAGETKPVLLAYLVPISGLPAEVVFSFRHSNSPPANIGVVLDMTLDRFVTLRLPNAPVPTAMPTATALPTATVMPTATPMPTATATPTIVPTPTLQPTISIQPPLSGTAPTADQISAADVAFSNGNILIRVNRVYSPAFIYTGDPIGNYPQPPDAGQDLLVFQLQAYNYNANEVRVYEGDFQLVLPNDTIINLDRGRAFNHRDELLASGLDFQVPDMYQPLNPVYNVLRLPPSGIEEILLVFQVPVDTLNTRLTFRHSNLPVAGVNLLFQPDPNDNEQLQVISEGTPGNTQAYYLIAHAIGTPEAIPGGLSDATTNIERFCIPQPTPYTLRNTEYERVASENFEELRIAPQYELSGAASAEAGIIFLPFVRSLAGAFNLRIALGEYERRISLEQIIENTLEETIEINVPAQTVLTISSSTEAVRIPVTYTVWIGGYTFDIQYWVNSTQTTRTWEFSPCE